MNPTDTSSDNAGPPPQADCCNVLLITSNSLLIEGLRTILKREPLIRLHHGVNQPSEWHAFQQRVGAHLVVFDVQLALEPWSGVFATAAHSHEGTSLALLVSSGTVREQVRREVGSGIPVICADRPSHHLIDELVRIASRIRGAGRGEAAAREALLSRREMDTLREASLGSSNKEISDQLGVSVETVKYHLKNVQVKLGVANRMSAVLQAIRLGLIDLPSRGEKGRMRLPQLA